MEARSAIFGPQHALLPFAGKSTAPLFGAASIFALGIVASRMVWVPPPQAIFALPLFAALAALAAWFSLRIAWLPMAMVWLFLGIWCAEMEPEPVPSAELVAVSDGLARTIEGTIVQAGPVRGAPEQDLDAPMQDDQPPVQRVELRVASVEVITEKADEPETVSGGVRLNIKWSETPANPFHCGERIRATARMLPPEVYHDQGAWNGAGYLLDRGITATASVGAKDVERLGDEQRQWLSLRAGDTSLRCAMNNAQRSASSRLTALPALTRGLPAALRLSPDDAIMLSAMITGDRTFLSRTLRMGFERTGSFHMLVVSGFHLAIVSGCIFWIAKWARMPRVSATLFTIAISLGYALFTGFGTPVQRSFSMVTIYLLGRLIYREGSPLNVIGFASLCLLVASPRSLFESGFQMTLLAVVSIAGIAVPLLNATVAPLIKATRDLTLVAIDVKLPPRQAQFRVTLRMFARGLQSVFNRAIGWRLFPAVVRVALRGFELLAVSVVVELAMALPMAAYFHRVTLLALPVNLFVFPLLLILVPAAISTLVVLLLWPAAALIPAAITAMLLHIGVGVVRAFGSSSMGDLRTTTPLPWQWTVFTLLFGGAVLLARGAPRRRAFAIAALLLAAATAVVPRPVQHPRDALLFEAIDVGQGDSLLLISPDGRTLLIDGGGFGGGPRQAPQEFDIGEEVVSAALWSRGIRHLDAVALTHAHADHLGGLPSVLRNFHPRQLWVGKNPPVPPYRALLKEAAELGIEVRSLQAGDAFDLGGMHIGVFAPAASYAPGSEPVNNDSLVMRASFGGTSIFLEGDAEAPVERSMLGDRDLESSIIKVGHHGSLSSSTPEFIARVAPQWAIISCGLRNRYGHPRAEVLGELERSGVRTYSTDINGAMCFHLDGTNVWPDPHCD